MNHQILIEKMAHNALSIQQLVGGISPAQAVWKPRPQDWSILEVITHLADEERLDFRVRLELMLHNPKADWPRIDPGGWVTARRYQQRSLAVSLKNFIEERAASLDWLSSLGDLSAEPDQTGDQSELPAEQVQVLEDGRYLLIGGRDQTVDMSRYIVGGTVNATVHETVLQEFTPEVNNTLPVSQKNLEAIKEGMYLVVRNERGTAYRRFLGLRTMIYGKTGTATTSVQDPHSWFAGFT
ncbi:MAG: hypothetical protein HGA86_02950, partial [Anaerolineaceae bacterium]|nr:hypothetical protein [Anaerolineaceae bacterium]